MEGPGSEGCEGHDKGGHYEFTSTCLRHCGPGVFGSSCLFVESVSNMVLMTCVEERRVYDDVSGVYYERRLIVAGKEGFP